MNKIALIDIDNLKKRIYTIRGMQVMLDRDLADLYEVETRRLNEQVRRNINRFPYDFMFQLSKKEYANLMSQNAISRSEWGGVRKMPLAFTEQGVASLSGVLKSEKAVEVNIRIMRAFVAMRRLLISDSQIYQRLDNVEKKQLKHDKKFEMVFDAIESKGIKPEKGIFFDGQVFDAYKFVSGLVKSAQKSIILIDNFVDESILTIFCKRKKGVVVKIYTRSISKQLRLDVEKFNRQYSPIEVVKFERSHDRFLIIDDKELYHIGASLKDLGKKWFAFSRFDRGFIQRMQKIIE